MSNIIAILAALLCTSLVQGTSFRLPLDVTPFFYKLTLHPHLYGNFTIDGFVAISLVVHQPTDRITLHANEIVIFPEDVQVESEGMFVDVASLFFDKNKHFCHIGLTKKLQAQVNTTVSIKFQSKLANDLEGFYKMAYTDEQGNERIGAATQFSATGARKTFPCFDEPALKAKFEVCLIRDAKDRAICNMPIRNTSMIENSLRLDCFETTIPMSTYILAFVVGDFHPYTNSKSANATTIQFWGRKTAVSQMEIGFSDAVESLDYLEEYFGIPYPLPKMDFVAVPEMGPNAMENFGLIIGRETALLTNTESSISHRQWVAYLITHELAHQWFGNLVTMDWWTDTWLNEGFATYLGYDVIDKLKPQWKVMERFVENTVHSVLQLDALLSAPAVRVEVEDPDEIRSVFGPVAYKKGASLICMMRHFLSETTLRLALTNYLEKLQYQTSHQDDLWFYLTKQAHRDGTLEKAVSLKDIMESWTLKPGFPVVTVARNNTHMSFTQERFLKVTPVNFSSADTWWVPLSWVHADHPNFEQTSPKAWLQNKSLSLPIQGEKSSWVLVNPKRTGFYRVNYQPSDWNLLINQLQQDHTIIHVMSRAQLIDDAFNLARSGYTEYTNLLNLVEYLPKEREMIPWLAASRSLNYLLTILEKSPSYGAFRDFLLAFMDPIFQRIKSSKLASDEMTLLRKGMYSWACKLNHPATLKEASHLLTSWKQNPSNYSFISGESSSDSLCVAIRHGNSLDWDFVWQRFLECQNAEQKRQLAVAMGCSRNIWILNRYLEASMDSSSGITRQMTPTVFSSVASNTVGSLVAWDYTQQHWNEIKDYLDKPMLSASVVHSVTWHLNTELHLGQIKDFEVKYRGTFGSSEKAVNQAIENVEANVAWRSRNEKTIIDWLQSKGFSSKLQN